MPMKLVLPMHNRGATCHIRMSTTLDDIFSLVYSSDRFVEEATADVCCLDFVQVSTSKTYSMQTQRYLL